MISTLPLVIPHSISCRLSVITVTSMVITSLSREEEEETLLMVFHAQEELHSNKWYLDSGCSNHMCGNKSLFSYLDELQVKDCTFKISRVFYVPELKSNLISMAYAYIPNEKRKKLNDEGVKCIFLGVSEESKAYRLYNPVTKKILISRDVIFDEEQAWDWNDLEKQPFSMNIDEEKVEMKTAQLNQQTVQSSQQPVQLNNRLQLSNEVLNSPPVSVSNEEQPPGVSTLPVQLQRKRSTWMNDYVDNTLFKQIVGSLMYLIATRPDIMYAVSLISIYIWNVQQSIIFWLQKECYST
ncbi:hypothetical protein ACOSP7_004587 [Xanthoceras sorbifolium]